MHKRIGPLSTGLVARMRGEWGKTVIVFSSAHGEMNGDHGMIGKATFLNGACRVPLIVRDPQSAAGRSEALVELMDVGATLCDFAGAQLPATSVARSLRPTLSNPGSAHRDVVVSQIRGKTMIMDAQHKLLVNTRGEDVFLTDQIEDPKESTNLLVEGGASDVLAEMRDQLLQFHLTNRHRAITP
ncbi:MAG: arylsulfatase A-like enzyme [Candidatus Aldehydirespiratoraceae bacterium]|jgi:arylsulfatase A-like enzyme